MKSFFTIIALLLAAGLQAQQQPPQQPATPTADEVAHRAFDMLAGPAWPQARYFAFTFDLDRNGTRAASFPQRWDRATGDYRVSGTDPQGHKFDVIMNVNTKAGKAWVDGKEVPDAQLPQMLELGYRRYVNDVFWLLMPLRMLEPGAHRTYERSRDDTCGHSWDVLRLTFDASFGLGQNDVYLAWVNRETGLVDYWDMKLTGSDAIDPPVSVYFRDFRRVGGLLISTVREIKSKGQVVHLDDLQVLPAPPQGAFQR